MGKEELRKRDTWQDYSGANAGGAEKRFYTVFSHEFDGSKFKIIEKPKKFRDIYIDVELSPEESNVIYTPSESILHHGIVPDYAIENTETYKRLYVEVKRQDG